MRVLRNSHKYTVYTLTLAIRILQYTLVNSTDIIVYNVYFL